jgi:hypothetical protein
VDLQHGEHDAQPVQRRQPGLQPVAVAADDAPLPRLQRRDGGGWFQRDTRLELGRRAAAQCEQDLPGVADVDAPLGKFGERAIAERPGVGRDLGGSALEAVPVVEIAEV